MKDQTPTKTQIPTSSNPALQQHPWRVHGIAVAVLGAIVLSIFADVLLDPRPMVVGAERGDMYTQFAYWRQFGFGELAKGNLALWNPHIFCGSPYFGGAQSALLYPPNWLFMVLPLATALNLSLALHLWLAGVFMYAWAFRRSLGVLASLTAGVVLMLSGAVFMKIQGHLPHLCTIAWAPLILLTIDELVDRPSLGWVLVGALAVAMQVLAGYPPHFFDTAVVMAVYGGLNLLKAQRRFVSLGAIVGVFLIGVSISAVQFLTTLWETSQTVRSGSMDIAAAGQYSFPPENFLCFLAPAFFGGALGMPYWGRWFLAGVQPFIGMAGLFLAVYGAVVGPPSSRRFSILMVIFMLVLALGAYIPIVFRFTHDYLPGFGLFRGSSRFLYFATLFLAMLCGVGLRTLIASRRFHLGSAVVVFLAAVALALVGWTLYSWASAPAERDVWAGMLGAMDRTGESWQAKVLLMDGNLIAQAGKFAAWSVFIVAATGGVMSLILVLTCFLPRTGYLVAVLAIMEMFIFGRFTQRPTFQLGAGVPAELRPFVQSQGDDSRTLNIPLPDLAMAVGGADAWGYDSFILRRYKEFMNNAPSTKMLSMLRCRAVFQPQEGLINVISLPPPPMSRLHLVGQYQVRSTPEGVLAAMGEEDFNPRQTVILEEEPAIAPAGASEAGWAKVTDSSTDCLTIQAELSTPAILLITDSYSKFWRGRALPGSSQKDYAVVPADYCLRAVPLAAGRHEFRLEYLPTGFLIGRWVSGGAVAAYAAALILYIVRRRRRKAGGTIIAAIC
jgi:hypothetical protein